MQAEQDKLIVWPPVIIVQNAGLGRGPEGKSIGLENGEIRMAISPVIIEEGEYRRVLALYGHGGNHLGVALILFPDTDVGYYNALKAHNKFKELGRGRDEWSGYKPSRVEEKKELFGYLADLQDMETFDRKKKNVKRWRMESFREKVLLPSQTRARDAELAKIKSEKKKQESDAVEQAMQADESRLRERRMQLAEMDEKLAAERCRQEELKKKFEEEKAKRRVERQQERERKLLEYKVREDEKRAEIQRGKEILRSELLKLEKDVSELQNSVHKQEKENQLRDSSPFFFFFVFFLRLHFFPFYRKRQKLAQLNARLASEMSKEKHLMELEERKRKEITKIKEEYQAKLLNLKEKLNNEKVAMYVEHRGRKEALDHRVEEEQETQVKNSVCVICMDTIKAPTMKRLYVCGHSCVCENCFPEVWKSSKDCPYCRAPQKKKPTLIPAIVYLS